MPDSVDNTRGPNIGRALSGKSSEMSYDANIASRSIARENFKKGIKDNKSIKAINDALLKYASRLLYEDKIRLLSEQGERVYNGMSEDELNGVFVESLVTNLTEAEINKLVEQAGVFERQFSSDMKRAQANLNRTIEASRRAAREARAIRQQEIKIQINNGKERSRVLKQDTKTDGLNGPNKKVAGLNRVQMKGLNDLKKELNYILTKIYFKGDVYRLATNMDIALVGGERFESVKDAVISKCLVYASIMLGKVPRYIAGMLTNDAPYKELLSMTSYSYLTGTPGKSIKQVVEEQKRALAAKAQMKLMNKSKKGSVKLFGIGPVLGAQSRALNSHYSKLVENEYTNNGGITRLMDMAAELGISTTGKIDLNKLMKKIADALSSRQKERKRLEDKINRAGVRGKIDTESQTALKAINDSDPTRKKRNDAGNTMNGSTPIVSFGRNGEIVSKVIDKAVPVFIVGHGKAGRFEEDNEADNTDPEYMERSGAVKFFDKTTSLLMTPLKLLGKILTPITKPLGALADQTIGRGFNKRQMLNSVHKNESTRVKQVLDANGNPLELQDRNYMTGEQFGEIQDMQLDTAVTYGDMQLDAILKKKGSGVKSNNDINDIAHGVMTYGGAIYEAIKNLDERIKKKRGINSLRINSPLAELNTTDHSFDSIGKGKFDNDKIGVKVIDMTARHKEYALYSIGDKLDSINSFLSTKLPLMMSGQIITAPMGVGTITNPMAMGMLGVGMVEEAALKTAKASAAALGINLDGPVAAHAEGGHGKFVGSNSTTKFISGDSLNGKENKELVDIDWANKTYRVKPIPEFATGGTSNMGNTKVTKMSSTERNAPMNVGITSPLATYSISGTGFESSDSVALKVVNVTPGIYDVHPNYNMSAMDALIAMNQSLLTLVNLGATDVELSKVVASSISALGKNGRSSGTSSSGGFTNALNGILVGE